MIANPCKNEWQPIGVIYAKFCEKLTITQNFPDHPLTDIIDIYLAPKPRLAPEIHLAPVDIIIWAGAPAPHLYLLHQTGF